MTLYFSLCCDNCFAGTGSAGMPSKIKITNKVPRVSWCGETSRSTCRSTVRDEYECRLVDNDPADSSSVDQCLLMLAPVSRVVTLRV